MHTRGYSTLLQRVLTDFGAEAAFGQIPARAQRTWEGVSPTPVRDAHRYLSERREQ